MNAQKRYLHLDTKTRTLGTIEKPTFQLQQPINLLSLGDLAKKTKLKIKCINAQIPYSFYTVQSFNNKFKYSILDVSYEISIHTGNYNIFSLMREIKKQLLLNFIDIEMVYSSVSNKISISSSDNFDVIFDNETLYNQLGFDIDTTISVSSSPIESVNCINVQPANAVYIRASNLMQINTEESSKTNLTGYSDIIAKIPINVNSNDILIYEPNNPIEIIALVDRVNQLNLRITDENDNLLFMNGLNYQLSLEITASVF